ncbi:uncharacterized protein LOC126474799 [Schistocerca serialis cubense]|uniref:uncharacterized protein LOC126474799 n=1 Tax=Schistocerca serialis cubense TaxID=2023355 RepID=UPI00214E3495|nr:uncharacterized protein LOC126474799 [Schistocerca serialis cubense]
MESGCGSGSARHYVDPWDVASYEFLLGAPSTDSSDFYFVSPHQHQLCRSDGEDGQRAWSPSSRTPELAASLEEAHFCNGRLSWRRVRSTPPHSQPHALPLSLSQPPSASGSDSGSPLTGDEPSIPLTPLPSLDNMDPTLTYGQFNTQ